jgi:hypothetical protein
MNRATTAAGSATATITTATAAAAPTNSVMAARTYQLKTSATGQTTDRTNEILLHN